MPNSGRGGGIANLGSSSITGAYIGFNTAENEGGGLFTSGNAGIDAVTFVYNEATSATRGKGGGIYVRNGTTTLFADNVITNNTAAVANGGNGVARATGGTSNATLTFTAENNPDFTDDYRNDSNFQ